MKLLQIKLSGDQGKEKRANRIPCGQTRLVPSTRWIKFALSIIALQTESGLLYCWHLLSTDSNSLWLASMAFFFHWMPTEKPIDRLLHVTLHPAYILTCSKGFTMKSTFSHHTCAFWLSSGGWWHDKIWLPVQAGLNKMFFYLYVQFMWVGWSVAQIKRTGWQRSLTSVYLVPLPKESF